MKKALIFMAIGAFCCLFIDGQIQLAANSNPNDGGKSKAAAQVRDEKDRQLAADIKAVTTRSSDGLEQEHHGDGSVSIRLKNRFQNVMLARLDGDETVSACITDITEANAFFGRNLETGAPMPKTKFAKASMAETAARHGMSEQEYDFYSKLVEEYNARQAMYPESATFTISNMDGAAEGFNDPAAAFVVGEGGNGGTTRGQQRLNVFAYAASIWGGFLDSGITTVIESRFDPLACSPGSAVLGSAGANSAFRDFPGAPFAGTWYHVALANKIRASDGNAATAELNATFNSNFDTGCFAPGHRFYYGLDNATPANRTNLLVVVLHEMGHGLGFSSFVDGSTGAPLAGFPDIYMRFMYDRTVGLAWNAMSNAQRQASALNNGNVLWDGPSVKIGSGFMTAGREAATGRVQLYTPGTFAPGSSISHFDTASTPNLLMEPSINAGLAIDGDLARQQMRDIGWFRDTTSDTVQDTITNITPSGVVMIGSNVNITWVNGGSFNRNVTIELSTDGGANYTSAVATDVTNTGSFSWTVPNTPTMQARLRVREAGFAAPVGASSGNFTITSSSTAAEVSVSGRVLSSAGYGVSNARVILAGPSGTVFTAITNPFGYFRLDGVLAGETYTASVMSRRFVFEPKVLTVNDELSGVDFVAQP